MLTVAITGGLCSGKSLVAAAFRVHGWPVLDADAMGHALLAPGQPVFDEIVARFGREILDAAGCIDRDRLAARVFGADAAARAARGELNAILHPRIRLRMNAEFERLAAAGALRAAAEIVLLVENGLQSNFDRVILVTCADELKIARYVQRTLRHRPAADPENLRLQALARLAAQWPDSEKLAAADFVIDNEGDEAAARARAEEVIRSL